MAAQTSDHTESIFSAVNVLACHFTNCDQDWIDCETELLDTFKNLYNFKTEVYVIDNTSPHMTRDLRDKVMAFIKAGDQKATLNIFLYNGHAKRENNQGVDRLEFQDMDPTTRNLSGRTFDFTRYRYMLDTWTKGEVLVLLDCCYASETVEEHDGPELVAACAWYEQPSGNPVRALTKALTNTLKRLNGAPCKVAEICSIMQRDPAFSALGVGPLHIMGEGKSQSLTLERCK